jgi:imidazolonepropionase-like amidohydrolase
MTSASKDILIKAGRFLDGTGAPPKDGVALHIAAGRVKGFLPLSQAEATGLETIDLGARTVLPGMIDAHMHLFGVPSDQLHLLPLERESYRALCAAGQALKMLQAGITAARCLGSSVGPDVRRAIDNGDLPGPRLKVAGEFICSTSGTWDALAVPYPWMKSLDIIADGVDAVQAAVRRRVRSGSDFIKVGLSKGPAGDRYHAWGDDPTNQAACYSLEEVVALVQEAHRNKLKVSAHCIGEEPVLQALDAGVDIIEHGYGVSAQTRARLAQAKVPVVTTLTQLHHHRLAFEKFRYPAWEREIFERHATRMRSDFEDGLRAGVHYALGSDLIGPPTHPQWNAASEFELAVQFGMEPMQAIVAGTRTGAEVLGLQDDIGTLEPSKYADLIAVDDNPLDDISALQRPSFVMLGGRIVVDRRAAS